MVGSINHELFYSHFNCLRELGCLILRIRRLGKLRWTSLGTLWAKSRFAHKVPRLPIKCVTFGYLWAKPVLLIVFWKQKHGFTAFGITDESFQSALHSAFVKLGLLYKGSISRIELPSIDANLQASVQSWSGIGQLRVEQSRHKQALRTITSNMNEYFRTTPESAPLKSFIISGLVGMLIIIVVVYMEMIG